MPERFTIAPLASIVIRDVIIGVAVGPMKFAASSVILLNSSVLLVGSQMVSSTPSPRTQFVLMRFGTCVVGS